MTDIILIGNDGVPLMFGPQSATDEILAFHYGNFDNAYGDGTVSQAAANGRVYADTVPSTLPAKFGSIGTPTTASGQTTYTWTPPTTSLQANVLIVAGGGGGGGVIGGGGGAGGVVYKTAQTLNSASYTVKVGQGGTGGIGWTSAYGYGNPGKDSVFGTYTTAKGGGGGHSYQRTATANGGSGGGGAYADGNGGSASGGTSTQTDGYGNAGGGGGNSNLAAGGGGAGGAGGSVSGAYGGNGGIGLVVVPYGERYGQSGYFAGGGGGGVRSGGTRIAGVGGYGGGGSGTTTTTRAGDGRAHSGGGGGGAGYNTSSTSQIGGDGGSGIVLVRYITDMSVIGLKHIVTRNLAVLLDASDSSSYSGSGTAWSDISGNGRNATVQGAVSWVNNGSASYFDFPSANADYINQTAGTSQIYKDMCIVFQYEDSDWNYLLANGTASDRSLRIISNSIGNPANAGDWAQSATTYYVNGVADTNAVALSQNQWYILGGENKNTTLLGTAWDYYIGTGYTQQSRNLNGKIAFLALYTAPLTAAEHIENYNALKHRFGV